MMSTKKNIPNFGRQPVNVIALERRVAVLAQFAGDLLTLLATEYPSLKDKFSKLGQEAQTRLTQIDASVGEMTLFGHGPHGVIVSQGLKTEKDNKAFEACFPVPAEKPLQVQQLLAVLENYLALDGASEHGRGYVLPDESLFGNHVKDASKIINQDLLEQADGLWVLKTEDGQATYTLKLAIDEHVLLFTPTSGPTLVTYSSIEGRWVPHGQWALLDADTAVRAVEAFFEKTNVRDATAGELQKLYVQTRQIPRENLEKIATVTGDAHPDVDLIVGEFFKIHLTFEGNHSIISQRDDVQWTDLTLQTRRRLFREAVAKVQSQLPVSKEAEPAKKTVAKKAVKKAAAKKAAKA